MSNDVLFELNICNEVTSALYTLRKEDISRGGNRNYVRVFTKWLERYGVVDLSRRLAGVVEGDEL